MAEVDAGRPEISKHSRAQVEIQIKYDGYINKQIQLIERFRKLEGDKLPEDIDYSALDGVRAEAREKLALVRPASLGQAMRISGVSPADVNVLMIHLAKMRR